MPRQNAALLAFNHGIVSKLALARVDTTRLRFAAEQQDNWIPRTVGPMTLRPGLEYIGGTRSNAATKMLPFVFGIDDTALIELAGGVIRFRIDDALVTRPSVSTAVTHGDFSSSSGWTLSTTGGATSTISGGALNIYALPLGSTGTAKQTLSVAGGDQNVEHALRIAVARGPVTFRAGSSDGADDYVGITQLGTGTHSLAFTPTGGSVYIQFDAAIRYPVLVTGCQIEAAGTLELTSPWADSSLVRITQSADVVYVACKGYQQRKIERRATHSWSIVLYQPNDGPFKSTASYNVSITPSGTRGEISLTADVPFFRSTHAGSLMRITTTSQLSTAGVGAADTFIDPVRVTGVSSGSGSGGTFSTGSRTIFVSLGNTWVGTVTLQRSFDSEDSGFEDVKTYTVNGTDTINDTFDNSIVWYRLGFKAGEYTSGTADLSISYPGGGFSGVVRIDSISSSTVAIAEVLSPLSAPVATRDWQEGEWSDHYGWPSATGLYLGRLYWAGADRVWASVADAYESFDATVQGDAGPISRSIGYGPVETINWLLPISRMIVGTAGSEISVRTSATDEPITPTNFGLKDISTQGSAAIAGVKVDARGIFVQRGKRRVYQMALDAQIFDYVTSDLTALLPDLTTDFVAFDVARQPDTRMVFVMSDGTALCILYEPSEEIMCWYTMSSPGGFIEDVCTLPGTPEDLVYFVVRRTINSSTVRYIEKMARLDQVLGGSSNRLADAFHYYSGSAVTTITGLSHLEGETVVVWGNGKDLGTKVVSSGQITGLSEAVTTACIGLGYDGLFKSAKLAYAAGEGTPVTQRKRVPYLGLVLKDTHNDGLEFGPDFDNLDPLPRDYQGADVGTDVVYADLDAEAIEFPGEWDTDSRVCLKASAPRPCTVSGIVVTVATNEKPLIFAQQ